MNKRHSLILRGWCYALVGIAILSILAFKKIDEFGMIFSIGFVAFLAFRSYSCFKELKKTEKEDQVFSYPDNSPVKEKISYLTRIAIIGAIAFLILSVWTYFDLKDLESGTVEYVRLWAPISLLYDLGGFWLAVLATPLLGILTIFLLMRKIKELKYNSQ